MKLNFKLIILIVTIILSTNIIYSVNPQITIDENTKMYEKNSKINLNCQGTLEIYNPSITDDIYEFTINFRDDESLQFSFLNISTNAYVDSKKIKGREISQNSSIYINYILKGEINSIYKNTITKTSCMNWYIQDINLAPMRYVTLSKLARENPELNVSKRKVIVQGKNPTNYDVNIKYLDVFKTSTINWTNMTFAKIKLYEVNNLDLAQMQNFNFEVIDEKSDDETVYWLEYNIVTQNNVTNNLILDYISYSSGGKKDNDDTEDEYSSQEEIKQVPLKINKYVNQSNVKLNDKIEISITIDNPNNKSIENINLYQKIPNFFKLINNTNFQKITDSTYKLKIDKIDEDEIINLKYELQFIKNITDKTIYLSPAVLEYDDNIIYSNGITLTNDNSVTDKRIYVEKEIIVLENTTKVIIKVRNIGSTDLHNLVIVEDMADKVIGDTNYTLKKNYAKWVIDELKIGKKWETSYEIISSDVNKYIPEVFGLEDGKIYKTLLINEQVKITYSGGMGTWVKLLASIALILLIIDILF